MASPERSGDTSAAPAWSISDGRYLSEQRPPDRSLIKDIQYTYAHLDPVIQKTSVDGDLTLYAIRLCQPDLFEDPSKRPAKRAMNEDVRSAVAACLPYEASKLLDEFRDLAAKHGFAVPKVLATIAEFPVDDQQKRSLEAVAYYLSLQQSGLEGFLPEPPAAVVQ